jgi:ADP-ribose pyrophosphatase YjhB (NUDIX family)
MTNRSSVPTPPTVSRTASSSNIINAASIAVMRGGLVLLVLRKTGENAGVWAFPGGKVETDETFQQAAHRELLEETGVTATIVSELGRFSIDADPNQYTLVVFKADYARGDAVAADDAADVRWIAPKEALKLPLAEHMADALRAL